MFWLSTERVDGHFAGIFESDADCSWFYLHDNNSEDDQRVVGAIQICRGTPLFGYESVGFKWGGADGLALFIKGEICAAFVGGRRYGGRFDLGLQADIPANVRAIFQ